MVGRKKYLLIFSVKYFLLLFILLSNVIIPTICFENVSISNSLQTSPSCTIFTVSIGDTVFYGNNEDYRKEYLSRLRLWYTLPQNISVIGGERSIYGTILIGFLNEERGELDPYPCGGMNDHGLIFDINGLPSLELHDNPNGLPFWTNNNWYIHTSLYDCKNVEEVIEWYKTYKWDATIGGQIHYPDASGDAVVISVDPSTKTWAFTRKTGNFIVSTNFNLNDTSNAYSYPCSRYNIATYMLSRIENDEELTVQACADILYAVHAEGQSITLYSNIFDPVNLNVYFNHGERYQNQKKVNLLEVFSQRESFESFDISYLTGVDGDLLVKSEKIDENFYSSPLNSILLLVCVVIFVLGVMVISLIIYIYKRKLRV